MAAELPPTEFRGCCNLWYTAAQVLALLMRICGPYCYEFPQKSSNGLFFVSTGSSRPK